MLYKLEIKKPDGRKFIQYSFEPFEGELEVKDYGVIRPESWQAPLLRWNKMRGEMVAIASSRQNRPFLPPAEYCPLCEGSLNQVDPDGNEIKTEVPISNADFDMAVFENVFPGLAKEEKTGHCEVVLFSKKHEGTLGSFELKQIEGVINMWQDRSECVGQMDHIEHVFIFENKGEEIGVTLNHPHGQLYAFSEVPPFVRRELEMADAHHKKTGECLMCTVMNEELEDGSRIVLESDHLVAFVPYAARYPYEINITTKAHRPLIENLNDIEVSELALMLKRVIYKYNQLFGFEMPYIMAHHQAKAGDNECKSYHWHIEFYPPYRTAEKLKYLAGVESGTGMFINDTIPEEKAKILRDIECPF